jgi:hypothetical protein
MEPALRPMTLGEILDRTAQLYRANFVLFAGIFVVYAGVALVLGLLMIGLNQMLRVDHAARALLWLRLVAIGIEWLILALVAGASVAAICRAVAWVHLGEPATIRGAYLNILPRLGRYLWLMTITILVVYVPIALLYLGYLGTLVGFGRGLGVRAGAAAPHAAANPQALMLIGFITAAFFLLLIPAIVYTTLMSLRYALALPACVLEDLRAWPAIKRGIALSKGARGRIFVLGLLIFAIKMGVVSISQAFFFVAAIRQHGQLGPGLLAVSQVIGFFTNTFLGPIYATGITLFYYDQRVRKEGYDIEWMMLAAGLTPPAAAPFEPQQAGELPQPSEPTGPEFGESL